MDYTTLGTSGLRVSRVALGCMSYGVEAQGWRLAEEDARAFIRQALELGINFFDTANMYGAGESELMLGRALADFARRDEVVVATKVFYPVGEVGRGLSRDKIFKAIDESLSRLKMDHVDLYQIHRWDDATPIEETLEALHELVVAGKVRFLGASSMLASQFSEALELAEANGWTRFVSMQPHYNLLNREEEAEMLPLCRAEGVGIVPWSPLARGRLARPWDAESSTGRAAQDQTAARLYDDTRATDRPVVDALERVAGRLGLPMAQVALAWLASRPGVTAPIVGATKMRHLEDAAAALSVRLDGRDVAELEESYVPHSLNFFE
jgi:aryl-alcohol dehydrogenase-like predicted oxidoreductase